MNNAGKVIVTENTCKPLFEDEEVFARPDGLAVAVVHVFSDGMRACDVVSPHDPMWPLAAIEVSPAELSTYPRLGTRAEVAALAATMSKRAKLVSYVKGRRFALNWMRARRVRDLPQTAWSMPADSWLRE